MSDSIAFIVRSEKKDALEVSVKLEQKLTDAGLHVFYPLRGETVPDCRLIITFGGDGTLLAGTNSALKYGCPLMGVNMGDRKSTRLNSSHPTTSRMPSSA